MILKRGHELAQVLRVFDKKRFEVIELEPSTIYPHSQYVHRLL